MSTGGRWVVNNGQNLFNIVCERPHTTNQPNYLKRTQPQIAEIALTGGIMNANPKENVVILIAIPFFADIA